MAEITCSKAKTCARLHRLGTHACSNCSRKPIDDSSNEEPADNEEQTDSREMEHDDSSLEEHGLPKPVTRVRFPQDAPQLTRE